MNEDLTEIVASAPSRMPFSSSTVRGGSHARGLTVPDNISLLFLPALQPRAEPGRGVLARIEAALLGQPCHRSLLHLQHSSQNTRIYQIRRRICPESPRSEQPDFGISLDHLRWNSQSTSGGRLAGLPAYDGAPQALGSRGHVAAAPRCSHRASSRPSGRRSPPLIGEQERTGRSNAARSARDWSTSGLPSCRRIGLPLQS